MASTLTVDNIQGATTAGTVHMPAGHVVQVVEYRDNGNYTNSSTSYVQASQTSNFILKNSNNKVLVTVNCMTRAQRSSASGVRLAIYRGTVASGTRITNGSEPQIYTSDSGTEQYNINMLQILDTPAAASTTYSLALQKHSSSGDVHIYGSFFQTIITMQEISV